MFQGSDSVIRQFDTVGLLARSPEHIAKVVGTCASPDEQVLLVSDSRWVNK